MAAKQKTQTQPQPSNQKPPAGFENVGIRGRQNWFKFAPGKILQGILGGRFQRKTGNRKFFYLFTLTAPCQAIRKNDDDDVDIVDLQPNDTVCVDEKKALEELEPLCADGGKYEIWLKVGQKRNLSGNQTMWEVDGPYKKVLRAPTRVFSKQAIEEHVSDEEIPF